MFRTFPEQAAKPGWWTGTHRTGVLLQFAMLAFEDMAKLARPGAVTECLADDAVTDLIMALAREARPLHLLRVLEALVGDRRPLAAQALVALTIEGLSFVASWLPAALQSARTLQEVPGAQEAAVGCIGTVPSVSCHLVQGFPFAHCRAA